MQSETPFHSWHNRRTFAQLQPYDVIFAYFNHPYHPFMSYNGTHENKRMISNASICEIVEEYKRTNTQETRNYLREIMQIPARNVRHSSLHGEYGILL